MMAAAMFAFALAGLASIAVSQDLPPPRFGRRTCFRAGWGLICLSLLVSFLIWPASIVIPAWSGMTSIAALAFVLLRGFQPQWALRCCAVAAIAGPLLMIGSCVASG